MTASEHYADPRASLMSRLTPLPSHPLRLQPRVDSIGIVLVVEDVEASCKLRLCARIALALCSCSREGVSRGVRELVIVGIRV